MPWENERNLNSLSPHGLKAAEGHAAHVDVSTGTEIPRAGVCGAPLNSNPHQGGPKSNVYMPRDRTPLRGNPQEMRPPHTASPHRYAADPGPRESVVITPRTRP
jgi:hypothetical protein